MIHFLTGKDLTNPADSQEGRPRELSLGLPSFLNYFRFLKPEVDFILF